MSHQAPNPGESRTAQDHIVPPSEVWTAVDGGRILDENGLLVAQVFGQDEDNSDALKIAAAPQMLQALEVAERELNVAAQVQPQAAVALQTVRQAIAQARRCACPSPPERVAPHGAEVLSSSCPIHGERVRPELWKEGQS